MTVHVIPVKNGKEMIAVRVDIIGKFQYITLREIDYILVNKYVKIRNVNGRKGIQQVGKGERRRWIYFASVL